MKIASMNDDHYFLRIDIRKKIIGIIFCTYSHALMIVDFVVAFVVAFGNIPKS